MSKCDFYSWIYIWQNEKNKGKILREIIPSSPNLKGDKREKEIKKRVKNGKIRNETKSKFSYYSIKELSLHRKLFQSKNKKQFAEDVRLIYKEYILPSLNLFSEIKDKFGFQESFLEVFNITKRFNPPENLPNYSTYIQITFTLKKPYLSKDDENFYVIDNPIVKDKVFKLPMVRSTTWKGALRFAAIKVFENWVYDNLSKSGKIDKETVFKERLKIVRLFGNEKGNHEEYLGRICVHAIEGELPNKEELKGKVKSINEEFKKWLIKNGWISKEVPSRSGRLFFYPTFFDRISLDVITPLSRERKTPVRGPIYFEIVPESTTGILRILYYPFDLIAKGVVEKIEEELKEDMELLGRDLKKMFTETGFSAKKMSGFGVASITDVKTRGFKNTEARDVLIKYTKVNKTVN